MKMAKEKSLFFNTSLQMKKIVFDQYLWIKGHSHYNSGHPHQNNILIVDMLLENELSHQNIESKNEILTMQA
jgi:hypothetical protein